jgi:two-component system, LuxR family, response regulator FixJ
VSRHRPKPPPGRIHLVDDDDSLRTALERLLRAAGHEVRAYASAADFLMARTGPLRGCLLLDVRMPGGPTGLELHQALIRQGETLPVVFLTGHGDIPMSVQAVKNGAFDFLTKPVRREDLLKTVTAALAAEDALWLAGRTPPRTPAQGVPAHSHRKARSLPPRHRRAIPTK